MKIFLTIDQIHEEKAVLLTDEPEFAFDFPTSLLPEKAQAGDVLAITMSIDSAEKLTTLANGLFDVLPDPLLLFTKTRMTIY